MTLIQFITKQVNAPEKAVSNTVDLLNADSTIPFIARYRKEATGNLDEVAITEIEKLKKSYEEIEKRKTTIIQAIKEQDALDPELKKQIEACYDLNELEDLYLPYKKTRKTRADKARESGLEPLAKMIMAQNTPDPEAAALRFINDELNSVEEALQGARDIIAQWINERIAIRNDLRKIYERHALLTTRVISSKKDSEEAARFRDYFDWSEPLNRCPSHRLLAILRAEKEGVIRLSVKIDTDQALEKIERRVIRAQHGGADEVRKAAEDAWKRLLEPALSKEALNQAREKAEETAIAVFAKNLEQLLLGAPLGEKRILAIDPGYRSGCKVVCLDENGQLLHNENIYPHPPQKESTMAMKKISSLVNSYKIEAIAIGNGTASRETEQLVKRIRFDRDLQVFVVNEAGASVYSASSVAREEFPNYDVTVRGAVSIGRRLADPLAELVKIDPKSIGVGQYQHDVDQNKLKEELNRVVGSCVNKVGVNLNTASKPLLSYVSGIGEKLAENIIAWRSENGGFENRKQLLEVPRLGGKAFEQAAGFLRIKDGENPLDDSGVHPESYPVVQKILKDLGVSIRELIGNRKLVAQIEPAKYVDDKTGMLTLKDILAELEKPGLDPREKAEVFEFDKNVRTIDDLYPGQELPGIVNNITNFGCFVDIGIKQSGLVHVSNMADRYISDVNEIVHLHQHIRVKVLDIDKERNRIQLSMKLDA
ncbi:Tex family protein [Robertkochia aurantiaca]|uniref:Tex family protein n=1 Tax=Robertkochia aurantiaca TaxID=2873700 RepID=UPI001CCAB032|nr:Tex family protein [Robertkochia sp. 3YJGBD-33]